jgi:hypothetical protein
MNIQMQSIPLPRNNAMFPILTKYNAYEGNIGYRIDYKNKNFNDEFFPVLCAPIDYIKNPDKNYYWRLARKQCYHWLGLSFEITIYNGLAYFCQVAAAIDFKFNEGKNGWSLNSKNPFKKNNTEISLQAKECCYRCGFCLGPVAERIIGKKQFVKDDFLISETNV